MLSRLAMLLLILVLTPMPGMAETPVKFLNGGYSEYCFDAALRPDDPVNMYVTGSRLGVSPLEVCARAIEEADENRASSHNNRGVLLFASGDYQGALDDFDRALDFDGDRGEFHINRGLALAKLSRWEESIAAYDRGIALGSIKLEMAYYNRGIANEELGNINAAYADYREAARLAPEWNIPREELARFRVR